MGLEVGKWVGWISFFFFASSFWISAWFQCLAGLVFFDQTVDLTVVVTNSKVVILYIHTFGDNKSYRRPAYPHMKGNGGWVVIDYYSTRRTCTYVIRTDEMLKKQWNVPGSAWRTLDQIRFLSFLIVLYVNIISSDPGLQFRKVDGSFCNTLDRTFRLFVQLKVTLSTTQTRSRQWSGGPRGGMVVVNGAVGQWSTSSRPLITTPFLQTESVNGFLRYARSANGIARNNIGCGIVCLHAEKDHSSTKVEGWLALRGVSCVV